MCLLTDYIRFQGINPKELDSRLLLVLKMVRVFT
jgi:hypothetical protein